MFLQYESKPTNGLVFLALLLKNVTKENDQAYSHQGFLLKTVIPMLLILTKNGNNFKVSQGGGVNIL